MHRVETSSRLVRLAPRGRVSWWTVFIDMVQVFAASRSGMLSHARARAVHSRLAWVGGASMATTALVGALTSKYVSEQFLLVVFALWPPGQRCCCSSPSPRRPMGGGPTR
jgi:hypothetical protein